MYICILDMLIYVLLIIWCHLPILVVQTIPNRAMLHKFSALHITFKYPVNLITYHMLGKRFSISEIFHVLFLLENIFSFLVNKKNLSILTDKNSNKHLILQIC